MPELIEQDERAKERNNNHPIELPYINTHCANEANERLALMICRNQRKLYDSLEKLYAELKRSK